jgi:hypothetical protein
MGGLATIVPMVCRMVVSLAERKIVNGLASTVMGVRFVRDSVELEQLPTSHLETGFRC